MLIVLMHLVNYNCERWHRVHDILRSMQNTSYFNHILVAHFKYYLKLDKSTMDRLDKLFPWKMCITLRDYDNRIIHTLNTFSEIGWQVPLYIAERDSEDPRRGCYTSHVNVMKKAIDANVPYALVFEDDNSVNKESYEHLDEIVDEIETFLKTERNFDILLIGSCACDGDSERCRTMCVDGVTVFPFKKYKYIQQGKCWCTHAIVYSRNFMMRFVHYLGDFHVLNKEIDEVFTDDIPNIKVYMLSIDIFDQNQDVLESVIWGGKPVSLTALQQNINDCQQSYDKLRHSYQNVLCVLYSIITFALILWIAQLASKGK
jgi:GR25 family glycosyltransferase involved in LPS biosynthesis